MSPLTLLLAGLCIASVLANTHVNRISEEFIAKPNGQTVTAKAVLVRFGLPSS
jgi:hypothetical protein